MYFKELNTIKKRDKHQHLKGTALFRFPTNFFASCCAAELYKEIPTDLTPEERLKKLFEACLKVNFSTVKYAKMLPTDPI